ncbi:MAG: 2-amino-4-hydroxy-6-hydroxymethyldihydropteridine diphosphokinase [Paludibacteraceae bacterium]|nr:2-amino-4-hydroxy-6-hydroxymethyldihydropteridine diphosphokinase [Paludibacteraceae bacterium]
MIYYLGIGSNLGEREATIRKAIERLQETGAVEAAAEFVYSAPQGFESEHEFCNTVVKLHSDLSPHEMLARTQAIEQQLGRTEHSTLLPDGSKRYADREIDIDLIEAYEDSGLEVIVNTPELTLPHPKMNERDFVMQPLKEIITHKS